MRVAESYWGAGVVILFLVSVFALVFLAVGWVWEQLDAAGRSLLLVCSSVALYGFGCFMDWITGRSKKAAADRR